MQTNTEDLSRQYYMPGNPKADLNAELHKNEEWQSKMVDGGFLKRSIFQTAYRIHVWLLNTTKKPKWQKRVRN